MPSRPSIYSLGYQLRSIDAFIDLLTDAGVGVVVDVRETPWSRKRGFSKKALTEALSEAGILYEHVRYAGNPKELRRTAESHEDCLFSYAGYLTERPEVVDNLTALIDDHLMEGRSSCLICYERHPNDCHRSILLERIKQIKEVEVVHLEPDGAPRLSTLNSPVG